MAEAESRQELDQSTKPVEEDGDKEPEQVADEEEEEVGECGFCLFMKGGGCKDAFIEWENCIQEAENNNEDIVEKCFKVTGALKKCMEAHADYYEPILEAEKAQQEEVRRQLDEDKAQSESKSNTAEKATEVEKTTEVEIPSESESNVIEKKAD